MDIIYHQPGQEPKWPENGLDDKTPFRDVLPENIYLTPEGELIRIGTLVEDTKPGDIRAIRRRLMAFDKDIILDDGTIEDLRINYSYEYTGIRALRHNGGLIDSQACAEQQLADFPAFLDKVRAIPVPKSSSAEPLDKILATHIASPVWTKDELTLIHRYGVVICAGHDKLTSDKQPDTLCFPNSGLVIVNPYYFKNTKIDRDVLGRIRFSAIMSAISELSPALSGQYASARVEIISQVKPELRTQESMTQNTFLYGFLADKFRANYSKDPHLKSLPFTRAFLESVHETVKREAEKVRQNTQPTQSSQLEISGDITRPQRQFFIQLNHALRTLDVDKNSFDLRFRLNAANFMLANAVTMTDMLFARTRAAALSPPAGTILPLDEKIVAEDRKSTVPPVPGLFVLPEGELMISEDARLGQEIYRGRTKHEGIMTFALNQPNMFVLEQRRRLFQLLLEQMSAFTGVLNFDFSGSDNEILRALLEIYQEQAFKKADMIGPAADVCSIEMFSRGEFIPHLGLYFNATVSNGNFLVRLQSPAGIWLNSICLAIGQIAAEKNVSGKDLEVLKACVDKMREVYGKGPVTKPTDSLFMIWPEQAAAIDAVRLSQLRGQRNLIQQERLKKLQQAAEAKKPQLFQFDTTTSGLPTTRIWAPNDDLQTRMLALQKKLSPFAGKLNLKLPTHAAFAEAALNQDIIRLLEFSFKPRSADFPGKNVEKAKTSAGTAMVALLKQSCTDKEIQIQQFSEQHELIKTLILQTPELVTVIFGNKGEIIQLQQYIDNMISNSGSYRMPSWEYKLRSQAYRLLRAAGYNDLPDLGPEPIVVAPLRTEPEPAPIVESVAPAAPLLEVPAASEISTEDPTTLPTEVDLGAVDEEPAISVDEVLQIDPPAAPQLSVTPLPAEEPLENGVEIIDVDAAAPKPKTHEQLKREAYIEATTQLISDALAIMETHGGSGITRNPIAVKCQVGDRKANYPLRLIFTIDGKRDEKVAVLDYSKFYTEKGLQPSLEDAFDLLMPVLNAVLNVPFVKPHRTIVSRGSRAKIDDLIYPQDFVLRENLERRVTHIKSSSGSASAVIEIVDTSKQAPAAVESTVVKPTILQVHLGIKHETMTSNKSATLAEIRKRLEAITTFIDVAAAEEHIISKRHIFRELRRDVQSRGQTWDDPIGFPVEGFEGNTEVLTDAAGNRVVLGPARISMMEEAESAYWKLEFSTKLINRDGEELEARSRTVSLFTSDLTLAMGRALQSLGGNPDVQEDYQANGILDLMRQCVDATWEPLGLRGGANRMKITLSNGNSFELDELFYRQKRYEDNVGITALQQITMDGGYRLNLKVMRGVSGCPRDCIKAFPEPITYADKHKRRPIELDVSLPSGLLNARLAKLGIDNPLPEHRRRVVRNFVDSVQRALVHEVGTHYSGTVISLNNHTADIAREVPLYNPKVVLRLFLASVQDSYRELFDVDFRTPATNKVRASTSMSAQLGK